MNKVIQQAYAHAIKNGGVTFNNHGLLTETKGYMVGYKEGMTVDKDFFFADTLQMFFNSNQHIIENIENAYIGVWLNKGIWHLDISFHILSKKTAISSGIVGKQLAIYDLKNQEEIFLNELS